MLGITDRKRLAEHRLDTFGEGHYLTANSSAVHHHGELIPTQACDRFACPDDRLQSSCNLDEQYVARRVAQGVVHGLEAVEVEQQHRDLRAVSFASRQRLIDSVKE